MPQTNDTSNLIDVVHHEHAHLCRLFDDIGETFEKLASGELEEPRRSEVIDSAQEDLQMALEEMLHHFNQEEELFFVEIEEAFPEYAKDIERLVAGHEMICERTRWLNRQLKLPDVAQDGHAEEVLKVVKQMCKLVHSHATNENRLFDSALARMPVEQRERLREEIRKL